MATGSVSEEMIMAYGDNGLEPTPADEIVWIPELPLARHPVTGGNAVIPATIRALPQAYGAPKRLTGIRKSEGPWPRASWRDANGQRGSCFLRNSADACDPLFASLPASSRARLVAAMVRAELV